MERYRRYIRSCHTPFKEKYTMALEFYPAACSLMLPTWWCYQSPTSPCLALKPHQQRKNDGSLSLVTLLKGTEGPICRPDPLHSEGCYLPGAKDMRKKLPCLVRPPDYYPLLLFQVGSNDIGRNSLKPMKKDFRALGRQVKGLALYKLCSSLFLQL